MTMNFRSRDIVVLDPAADAARFLAQATFGADLATINALAGQDYGDWIDDQMTKSISLTTPYMEEIYALSQADGASQSDFSFFYNRRSQPGATNFSTPWMRNIVHGEDALRQRVAWCLSQIFVVSYRSMLARVGVLVAKYYDMLATHALGNYRDLLLAASTHTAMAYYLSSLGNQKADPSINRYPDENYAREVMQLFSIGLWELNDDGTRKKDGEGNDIPTYTNEDVTEMARVFTGMWFEDRPFGRNGADYHFWDNLRTQNQAMFEEEHDTDAKVVFANKAWREAFPAGQTGWQDIEQAVDMLFNHPNTPPFICRQLIQFLVKSDPSVAYVNRIADVFRNNGSSVRGDLGAVVKTILLDEEARTYDPDISSHGKLIEPMVRLTRVVKAFKGGQNSAEFVYWRTNQEYASFEQWPMASPSVFNFYVPAYLPSQTPLGEASVNAPVFGILNAITIPEFANYLKDCIFDGFHIPNLATTPDFILDLTDEAAIAADDDALLARLNLLLCYGQMHTNTETLVRRVFDKYPANSAENIDLRIKTAIYLIAMAPDGAILQ